MKKKVFALAVVMMMVALTVTGCSTHESEIAKEQREANEAMEAMLETETVAPHEPDPTAPDMENILVFSVKDGDTGLENHMTAVYEISGEEITEKLIEYGVLPVSAEVVNYDPANGTVEYMGVENVTGREAMAVINTIKEADPSFDGMISLRINGEEVMNSGFCADYESITDDYAGGANDSDGSEGGPGVE